MNVLICLLLVSCLLILGSHPGITEVKLFASVVKDETVATNRHSVEEALKLALILYRAIP